jgi:hypothetical protein
MLARSRRSSPHQHPPAPDSDLVSTAFLVLTHRPLAPSTVSRVRVSGRARETLPSLGHGGRARVSGECERPVFSS